MQKKIHKCKMASLSRKDSIRQACSGQDVSMSKPLQLPVHSSGKIPSQNVCDDGMCLPTSGVQKFFIMSSFLLTAVIVLLFPILVFQRIFFPDLFDFSYASSERGGINHTQMMPQTSTASTVLGPMGTTILPPTGQQIMTGVSMNPDFKAVDVFEHDAGKPASILMFYQPWSEHNSKFPLSWATIVRQRGSLPMITWEPWVPAAYPLGNDQPTYALSNIIAGKFDSYIAQWAEGAKAWRNPFFLRFAPEMNGNWTPWSEGLNGNTLGEFVQAWRHVHDIFTKMEVTNATWVWCPNVENNGGPPYPLTEFYPGDAYVDWTAVDGFNWGTARNMQNWQTFSDIFNLTYTNIVHITTKPILIPEVGCVEQGGNKAEWITDAYSVVLNNFPLVRGIIWYNQQTQEDWRIETSATAMQAFSQSLQSDLFTSNSYGNYTGG